MLSREYVHISRLQIQQEVTNGSHHQKRNRFDVDMNGSLLIQCISLLGVFLSLLGCKISLFPILGKSSHKYLCLNSIFNF